MLTERLNRLVQTHRGGRMTKWKGQVASAAPYVLVAVVSVAAMSADTAQAEEISTALTDPVILTNDEDHTITDAGSITLTEDGVAVTIDGAYGNTFINEGSVEIEGSSATEGTGIALNGSLLTDGAITNNGVVRLSFNDESSAFAYGIDVNGAINGVITNNGTLRLVHGDAFLDEAYEGYGIQGGRVGATGQIINNGLIKIEANASSTVTAFGIHIVNDMDGLITNTGAIDIDIVGLDEGTDVTGIQINGAVGETGIVLNSYAITVRVDASESSAEAWGIYVDDAMNGTITNTGSVNVVAISDFNSDASAYGISVAEDVTGTMTNGGGIIATSSTPDGNAEAYGIEVDGGLTATGTITNGSGNAITAVANAEGFEGAAYGISIDDNMDGNILNAGSITANADGTTGATAIGIAVGENSSDAIENSGSIQVRARNYSSDDAFAAGIAVSEIMSGSIINSGTMTVRAIANSSSEARAAGVFAGDVQGAIRNSGTMTVTATGIVDAIVGGIVTSGDVTAEGSIENAGTIAANAIAAATKALVHGIRVEDQVLQGGTVENSGTITLTAASDTEIEIYGLSVDTGLDGTVTNSGDIVISNETAVTPEAGTAYGIFANNVGQTGSVINTGTIDITLIGENVASANGIQTSGPLEGLVLNNGTINVEAVADGRYSIGRGLHIAEDVSATGRVENTGAVQARSVGSADASASAAGIAFFGDTLGTVTNSGTVQASANAEDSVAYAYGVLNVQGLQGTILNSGTIRSVANVAGSEAYSYGMLFLRDFAEDAEIVNAGNIISRASGTVSDEIGDIDPLEAYGISSVVAVAGDINNTGDISAAAISDADSQDVLVYGIGADSLSETGSIVNTGTLSVFGSALADLNLSGINIGGAVDGTLTNTNIIAVSSDAATLAEDFVGTGIGAGSLGETGIIDNLGQIAVVGFATSTATAYGIHVEGDAAGAISNSGSIDIEVTAVDDYAYGYGIKVDGALTATGSIANDGDISVIAITSEESTGSAYGIVINGDLNGAISNTGTLELRATAIESSPAAAFGLHIMGNIDGSLTNTGTIAATATALGLAFEENADASAIGIYARGNVSTDSILSNNGTISARATSTTDDAEAYGYWILREMDGSFDNSGAINVQASGENESAEAMGLYISGSSGGNIANSGTIEIMSTGSLDADAYGIRVREEFDGDLYNSGAITAIATSADSEADGAGVYFSGDVIGDITNTGSITGSGYGDASASGSGIYLDGDLTGNLMNTGTINAFAEAGSASAEGWGVYVSGTFDGTFSNSGTITTSAESGETATAEGISFDDVTAGSAMVNSGTITAMATSDNTTAQAKAVLVSGAFEGDFTNSGTVMAFADATVSAEARAFSFEEGFVGDFTNSGTIEAFATSDNDSSDVDAFYVADGFEGNFTNTSTITASGEANGSGDIRAVQLRGTFDGDFTNSGTIVSTSTNVSGTDFGVYGFGVLFETVTDTSTVTNTGTISASVINDGTATDITAIGVYAQDFAGTFSNTGTITLTATGSENTDRADLYAVEFRTFTGEITDVGTISATADGDTEAYAIYLGDGDGTINIDTDDTVTGLIGVNGHDVNLAANGDSKVFVFEDRDVAAGTFTTEVNDPGSAWFIDGEGTENATYAAVAAADVDVSSTIAGNYGKLLDTLSAGLRADSTPVVTRNKLSFGGGDSGQTMRPFVSASIESADYEGSDTSNDANVVISNATFGFGGELQSGLMLSLGVGTFTGSGSSGPSDFDSTGFYGGVAVAKDFSGYIFDAGLGFGVISTDNTRAVGGGDPASASFDSTFVTANLGISRAFEMSNGMSVKGFGALRYTAQENDGYTETGSLADATVAAHTIGVTEAKLGVEAEYDLGDAGQLSGALTAVSRTISGDETLDVTVFGTTAPLQSATAEFAGLALSVGYEIEIADGAMLDLGLSQEFGDGGNGPSISAGISWSF